MAMTSITKYNQDKYPIIQAGYKGLSELTRQAYKNDLDTFNRIINKDIQDIQPEDILDYVKALQEQGFKNSTINRKIFSLSKIFSLYKLQGLIKANPISQLNGISKITKPVNNQITTEVELYDIKNVMQKKTKTTLIISALMSTGMRISELIGIKNDNIKSFSKDGQVFKKIEITGKGNKQREIYFKDELYQDIKKVFGKSKQGHLFQSKSGRPLDRRNLYKQIKRTFRKATGKEINPHQLRHFYATYKIKNEKQDIKAVSKFLGHSSAQTTLDMYVDTSLNPSEAILSV